MTYIAPHHLIALVISTLMGVASMANIEFHSEDFHNNIVPPDSTLELQEIILEELRLHGVNANLNHIDVSSIQSMYSLFSYSDFNGDISKWDVSNVFDMSDMFRNSKFRGDISKWNVSKVRDMTQMFEASDFAGDLSEWDVSNVVNMDNIFRKNIVILEEPSPYNSPVIARTPKNKKADQAISTLIKNANKIKENTQKQISQNPNYLNLSNLKVVLDKTSRTIYALKKDISEQQFKRINSLEPGHYISDRLNGVKFSVVTRVKRGPKGLLIEYTNTNIQRLIDQQPKSARKTRIFLNKLKNSDLNEFEVLTNHL